MTARTFPRTTATLALALALSALGVSSAQAARLELTVQGLQQPQGQLMLAVYDQPALWLRGKPLTAARIAVSATGAVTHVFEDLPEDAEIAVSAFHDTNGNGRLDSNAMGMPVEPYGFSQDAVGQFGPPKFEAARLKLNGTVKATLTLN